MLIPFFYQSQDEDQKFKERTLNEIEAEKKIKVEVALLFYLSKYLPYNTKKAS